MRLFPKSLAALPLPLPLPLLLFVFAVFGGTPVRGAAPAAPAALTYTVSMPHPDTHLLEVEMRGQNGPGAPDHVDLVLPVWTPGAYAVRDFARHVQEFAATDDDDTKTPLRWQKTDKNRWRIETGRTVRAWRVTYRVYANTATQEIVDQAMLGDRFALWNNAAVLMYAEGRQKAPAILRVDAPPGWKVATGLPPAPGAPQPDTFQAADIDVLYDSPVLAGTFRTRTFTVRGIEHRIAIQGDGNADAARIEKDLRKIVETTTALMGDIPYRNYTFLLVLIGGNAWQGLEHASSTAIAFPRWMFRADADYRSFLRVAAHEYFHTWNVKRIRPDVLGPFDYTRENPTRLLWVAEGLTRYYESLLLRRAGLLSDADYLQILSRAIDSLRFVPGRRLMSLEEASFDVWIPKAPEDVENTSVDYYEKGGIAGALLDLEIRRRSGGAQSLDDVMRALNAAFGRTGRNYTAADFQRACETAAGGSLDPWFARTVRGREEPDYDTALRAAGLRLDTTGGAEKPAEISYLGVSLADENGHLKIVRVQSDAPAGQQGLSAGDELLALDGMRVSLNGFYDRMDERHPGDTIRLTLFRGDELRTVAVTLTGRAAAEYRIVPAAQPDAAQTRLYQAWLGAPYPGTAEKKT